MKGRERQRGFTILELVVALLVIAIVAAILISLYLNYEKKAQAETCAINRARVVRYYPLYKTYYSERDDVPFEEYVAEQYGDLSRVCPGGGECLFVQGEEPLVLRCSIHSVTTTIQLQPVEAPEDVMVNAALLYTAWGIVWEDYQARYEDLTARDMVTLNGVDAVWNGREKLPLSQSLIDSLDRNGVELSEARFFYRPGPDGKPTFEPAYVLVKIGVYWAKYAPSAQESGVGITSGERYDPPGGME